MFLIGCRLCINSSIRIITRVWKPTGTLPKSGFTGENSGFMAQDCRLGHSRVWTYGSGLMGPGLRVRVNESGLWVRTYGSGLTSMVYGSGRMDPDLWVRVNESGLWVRTYGSRFTGPAMVVP